MRIAVLMVMVALLPNSHTTAPQAGEEEAIKAWFELKPKPSGRVMLMHGKPFGCMTRMSPERSSQVPLTNH